MDSFATIVAAAVGGLVPSLITAILTNGTLFLIGRLKLLFILCQIMTAFGSWFIFRMSRKTGEQKFSLDSFMLAGIISAVTNGIFGSSFAAFYHYNLTAIEQGILLVTKNIIISNLLGGILLNLVDKSIASFLAYIISIFIEKKLQVMLFSYPNQNLNSISYENKDKFAQFKDSVKMKRLVIKAEYVFFVIALFTFITALVIKKTDNKYFLEKYSEMKIESQFDKLMDTLNYANYINIGFDSLLYITYGLAVISLIIMQIKLNKRKNLVAILKAKEKTKKDFSRDLHDGTIQTLSALKLCLEEKEYKKAFNLSEQAIIKARELMAFSRIDLFDNFVNLIKENVRIFEENYKIKISVYESSQVAQYFSYETKVMLFKILTEALSNACRHSGANKIEIKVIDTANDFILSISDNGNGFNLELERKSTHAGLKIMEERAIALGGRFIIDSNERGTTLKVLISVN